MAKRYEEPFKKQIVALFNNDKSLADINREYGIAKSTVKEWIERYNNSGSFDINAMCKLLKIPRSLVYYHINNRLKTNKISKEEVKLENEIIRIFKESRNNYGTRKIKKQLYRKGIIASRRKIAYIMNKYSLVSKLYSSTI
ncbi:Transposase [Tepidibacter thalassicus DSM 15285]|uniref:Transposase n=1 Tax=Tepidibacter thalassicus DSM 15285 TaxID=1123350 RepID=A0A1M5RMQ3_9FIRM|nr:Transposase [Tepidibacter thalassicus DSM 15285]